MARCSVVGTDSRTQKHGNLSSQGRSTSCSDSDPSTVRGVTRQGHAGPMMLVCLHLHISPPWYRGVRAGTCSSRAGLRGLHMQILSDRSSRGRSRLIESWTWGASLSQRCIGKSTSAMPMAPMDLFLNVCMAHSAVLTRWLPGSTNWS